MNNTKGTENRQLTSTGYQASSKKKRSQGLTGPCCIILTGREKMHKNTQH